MPRLPRVILPGVPHHVVQRGHNRGPVFFGDEDYVAFRDFLKTAAAAASCRVHAYVLMTNHYHILASPQEGEGLSAMIQTLGRLYVRHVNKAYGRSGTLWEGRFKASAVDADDYLFACMRYIEMNPVRAKMSAGPKDYPWSSHARNAYGEADGLITPHYLYTRLASDFEERAGAYRALFRRKGAGAHDNMIRAAANAGWAIGDGDFVKSIERRTGLRASPASRGGDRRSESFEKRRKA